MKSALLCLLVLAASGCAADRPVVNFSACAAGETTYACQVERYQNVNQ